MVSKGAFPLLRSGAGCEVGAGLFS